MLSEEGAVSADDFAAQRRAMVDSQVRTWDVTDYALLTAMYGVPRERFVAPAYAALAYADCTLPAAGGTRRLLRPMVVGRMLQETRLTDGERVLDIAGGSGYSAALMARLAGGAIALESDPEQTAAAAAALASIGERRVLCVVGPIEKGAPEQAPFDAIFVNGAIEEVPEALARQLKEGGRLIAIDASFGASKAVRFEKIAGEISKRPLFDAWAPVLPGFQKAASFVF